MIIAGYCRVSTIDQNVSLDVQEKKIKAYCDLHEIEVEIFREKESGKNLERKILLELLRGEKRYDGIIVASLDRLTRNLKDFCNLLDNELKGKRLISVRESFDIGTPVGEFALHMMVAFSQLERKLIGERTKIALSEKKKNGVVLGRKGIEYNNPLLVREIVRMRKEGLTLKDICERTGETYRVVQRICSK